jgi:phosphoribosyl 1,2-cyclic phosphate phosphodiesterase
MGCPFGAVPKLFLLSGRFFRMRSIRPPLILWSTPQINLHPIEGVFDLFGRRWTPIYMPHGNVQVLGLRVGNFAYCTDCSDIPQEERYKLANLDVLIIDALRPSPHPTHLSFEQALGVIADLKPRRAFFTHLTHDVPHAEIERNLPPHVRVLYDGLQIQSNF